MLASSSRAGCLLLLFAACAPAQRMAGTYPSLQSFLDSCPQNDPYLAVIRRDFQILRDGTPAGDIACTEPYSKLPASQVTEELTAIQALRFAYYMDMGQSGYLPWTHLRLYDWIKSRVAGINIDTTLGPDSVAALCCEIVAGRRYIVESTITDVSNRMYRQTPDGMAAQVALIAHETRHSEGNGYSHVSCCGIAEGCDQTYDENNLSPYGIQYYLAKQWLTGAINLGYSCDPALRAQLAGQFLRLANVYPGRFCDQPPPALSLPPSPGGACIAACVFAQSNSPAPQPSAVGGISSLGIDASAPSCGWTADSAGSWIFPASGSNSMGTGVTTYGFEPNPGETSRPGTLIVAGLTVPVTQAGCSPCTPEVHIDAVVSGAPFVPGIAGGSWVTVYGRNLATTTRPWNSADFSGDNLPLSLDGVSVRIDGQAAAVGYISPTQLNVQSPDDGATGVVQVQVANRQGAAAATASLQTFAPAFFTFGAKYVAAVHADGTYVGPPGLLGASVTTRPAIPGEVVELYGTGFGPTNPPEGAGVVFLGAAPLAFPAQTSIQIGGTIVKVQFAGLTGAGLDQINVTIPDLPDGDWPVVANAFNGQSAGGIFITIQR